MARVNKLYEKPRVTSIAASDLLTIGQAQSDGSYKVKTVTRANEKVETVTYAELLAKATASTLVVGAWYKITNATASPMNLLVQAISTSAIHCDAKDPLYQNDVVKYNFTSNAITWRWDTVNDISAGEDWRNSGTIQIGANSSKIQIGIGSTVVIGANSTNLTIGNACTINSSAALSNCTFVASSGVTSDALLQNLHFFAAINIINSPQKATIVGDASNYGVLIYDADGVVYLQYMTTGGVFTTLQINES